MRMNNSSIYERYKIGALVMVLLLLLVLLSSCESVRFDTTLLQATGEKMDPLLPRLSIAHSNTMSLERSDSSSNTINANSYLYTIWEREVETNICSDEGDPAGFIEMVLVYYDTSLDGFGSDTTSIEIEIRIYDLNNNRVWKSVHSGSETYRAAMSWSEESDHRMNHALSLYKGLIEEFKAKASKNIDQIETALTK